MPDLDMMGGGMPQKPDNHEAAMARADLYKSANYSFKLFKMIQDGQELEGWVQAKITKAADYIASVYHYMEYEMKFNEYGKQLEDSDVYSESVKQQFKLKLTEARVKMEKLKAKNIKDLDEADALQSRKGVNIVNKTPRKGQTDLRNIPAGNLPGSRNKFTDKDRAEQPANLKSKIKASLGKHGPKGVLPEGAKPDFLDADKDGDRKEPMKKAFKDKKTTAKKTDEGIKDVAKKISGAVKKAGSAAMNKLHGSDDDMIKDLQKKVGMPQTGKKPMAVQKEASHQASTTMKHVKNPTAGEKKAAKDIKPGIAGYRDRIAMLKSAEKDGRLKEGNKPDFLDMDKDGDKKEPMKKAVADKKKNPFAKKA